MPFRFYLNNQVQNATLIKSWKAKIGLKDLIETNVDSVSKMREKIYRGYLGAVVHTYIHEARWMGT